MQQTKFLALGASLALALFFAGCAKDNTPKPKPLVSFKPALSVQTIFDVSPNEGADGKYLSFAPAIGTDMVVTVSANGEITASNKANGDKMWSHDLDQTISSTATISGGRIFVGTINGWIYALDEQSGKLLWQSNVPSEVLAAPAANNTTVVVHSHDGSVTAFSADRGDQLWQATNQSPSLSLEGNSKPVIAGDNVIVGFDNGELSSYSLASGSLNWQRPVAIPAGGSEVSQMVDISGTPVVKGGIVYVTSYHGNLVAVNALDGSLIWQQPLSSYRSLAVSDDAVVITDEKGDVKAYNRETGQIRWTQSAFSWRSTTAPQIIGQYVVVGDYAGFVHWLDLDSGRQLAQMRFSGKPITSQPVAGTGRVYLTTSEGELVALQPKA